MYAELKHHNQVRKGRELLNAYRRRGCTSWMVDELGRVVEELKSRP
jgi:hypothetical protein